MNTPAAVCPLRQLLASRHLDGELWFDWPVENCDGCGNRVTKCTCGGRFQ